MRLKLYADRPVRRTWQVLLDLALVAWVWFAVALARKVHDVTLGLATPGREVASSAGGLEENLRSAGRRVAGVPLVGDDVRKPFDGAGAAAAQLADAGRSQVHAVESLAFWLGVAVAVIPVVIALSYYLPPRVRFVRRATAGQRFLDSGADIDLFALRAMTQQPLHVLARVDPDPAGAWRRGDRAVIERLADVELKDSGLRLPARLTGPPRR
ncbi:hypothetical protein GCM10011519_25670 [Marmoricola endophyticus]|uniref:Uncharacterized protein n=1 Tax=Marmoricola endophyticus TaxID=2040280 RepID=A0A917BNB5_9ACTN|nr:hypothetical protein [Marmoricola endophyticus]GGF50569.1 hypothetical protein GCM10011519_25670 [Marmoricola endophyticus]